MQPRSRIFVVDDDIMFIERGIGFNTKLFEKETMRIEKEQ